MNSILCFGLVVCASLALSSAYPSPEPAQDPRVLLEEVEVASAPEVAAEDESLQPEESHYYGRHGWRHGGWGYGGYGRGWGHGGYGRGWGHGGGWGYGGGYGGGWGGGWYGR